MKQLSFSILVPVYKGSKYLQDALDSISRQNFPCFEIIICDDNNPSDRDEIKKTKMIIKKIENGLRLRSQYRKWVKKSVLKKPTSLPNNQTGFFTFPQFPNSHPKIRYVKNRVNLGSQGTIKKLASAAQGDVLFYLCQDDVLIGNDALKKTHDAFFLSNNIGVVTRPFYWFEDDIKRPVREVKPFNQDKDTVLSIFDGEKAVNAIFGSIGQISGLAYRKEFLEIGFHNDVFPGHIYPFAGILRNHQCVFLKDFTVAVRIKSSQSKNISSIYNKSPLGSWVEMFNTVYKKDNGLGLRNRYGRWVKKIVLKKPTSLPNNQTGFLTYIPTSRLQDIRHWGIKHIATHYEGLVQIKNFAPDGALIREIGTHLKVFWPSFFDVKFWFFVILTVLVPKRILLFLSDNYKRIVLSRIIQSLTPPLLN